jgi:hypothetical protein
MMISIKGLVALLIPFFLVGIVSEAQTFQYFKLDSALSVNSEQFGIGANGKSDKIKMAVLGPYKVGYIDKLDSGGYRIKAKEGKEMSYGSTMV